MKGRSYSDNCIALKQRSSPQANANNASWHGGLAPAGRVTQLEKRSGVCILTVYTQSAGHELSTSTRFVLAIHVLTSLAVTAGKPMRSEDLAFSVNTNATFIRSLLSRLQEAGLTTSQLGVGGGALLAKPPEKIRLLEVYRAVEDSEVFAFHRQGPNEACIVGRNIQGAIRPALDEAVGALEARLASTTIADVANEVARLGQFTIPWQGC
jgi:Rrf2 family protein